MIVLLHKVEALYCVNTLRTFENFSTTRLYKPKEAHATRSSFYMIASEVQTNHPAATEAVAKWKAVWRAATFDPDHKNGISFAEEGISEKELVEEFGPTLIRLGKEIWRIQAAALAKAPFTQGPASLVAKMTILSRG